MLFNSLEYGVFLVVVLCVYWLLPWRKQNWFLLLASYVFYGWWDVRFLFLIVISTAIDYATGLFIQNGELSRRQRVTPSLYVTISAWMFLGVDWSALGAIVRGDASFRETIVGALTPSSNVVLVIVGTALAASVLNFLYPMARKLAPELRRKLLVGISVCANLGLLGVFKYFDFFVDSANALVSAFGVDPTPLRLNIVLPVGISFYTFQTLSYTIGVYRREVEATASFGVFALFVSFFPQLVAGPIERASRLIPQITHTRSVDVQTFTRGLFLILFGLFKKVAIADGVAGSVDSIYATTGAVSSADVVLSTVLFAVQIYCDFSGYSDIARGTAKLLGFDLMTNFRVPYISTNPSEFWRRWHISLSTWLRDYLYIPLGGNKGTAASTYRNLMITMTLGGLWHGAAWNFVLWGIYQGAILCIHRVWSHARPRRAPEEHGAPGLLRKALLVGFFFAVTCYGWLLFRATSFDQIVEFTRILIRGGATTALTMKAPTLAALAGIPLLLLLEASEAFTGDAVRYRRTPAMVRGAVYAALFFVLAMGLSNEPAQFIYFQF